MTSSGGRESADGVDDRFSPSSCPSIVRVPAPPHPHLNPHPLQLHLVTHHISYPYTIPFVQALFCILAHTFAPIPCPNASHLLSELLRCPLCIVTALVVGTSPDCCSLDDLLFPTRAFNGPRYRENSHVPFSKGAGEGPILQRPVPPPPPNTSPLDRTPCPAGGCPGGDSRFPDTHQAGPGLGLTLQILEVPGNPGNSNCQTRLIVVKPTHAVREAAHCLKQAECTSKSARGSKSWPLNLFRLCALVVYYIVLF